VSHVQRLALALVFLALPLASAGIVHMRAETSHVFDPARIPSRLGEFEVVSSDQLPDDVRALVSPDAYLLRLYDDGAGTPVWAYVAFYSGLGASGAHDPTVCYPAQGWDVAALRERAIELSGGERLRASLLAATQAASEELVLYWFQPPERWPSPARAEPLLRALDGLAGRSRYAFVRLSTRISAPAPSAIDAAETRLASLARQLAEPVREAVRGRAP
jgi:EpsI family protein